MKKTSPTLFQTSIEKFSHDGRGIARIEGKTTFIAGALPNEMVTFQYKRRKKDFDEGQVVDIIEPSRDRVVPACLSFENCGGCSFQHLTAEAQIQAKHHLLIETLERIGHVKPAEILSPLTSDVWHYRNKARLSVRYVEKKQTTLVGFREKNNPRYIAEIDQCLILNKKIDAQLIPLRTLIDSLSDPRMIAQIEVAAGDDDVALIFRNLSSLTTNDEDKFRTFGESTGFKIFLQPQGPDSVYLFYPTEASIYLNYALPNHGLHFKFHPTDFTQINGPLNRVMIEQTLELLALNPEDVVLDLFCGLGNFSLPLAKYCAKVVGVEGSQRMVERAMMNATFNQLTNTEFFCANLEDEVAVQRYKSIHANKVLLDPPRTGAETIVKNMHHFAPSHIVYVSCNPATLARDVDILVNHQGYRLMSAGVMDMFPHTGHVESIALLRK